MARLHTSFVLGYHGCSRDIGERILAGDTALAASDQDYDWLGPGVYFWEADLRRAWDWADAKASAGGHLKPFVVGAAIDLGNCLDLMARDSLELLGIAYDSLVSLSERAEDGRKLPENKGRDQDKLLRYLDCAVIRNLHQIIAEQGRALNLSPFDSVRGLFTEGGALYPGSGFMKKTHVQLAVRTPDSVKGYFRVSRPSG
jgi:hypothetical protein